MKGLSVLLALVLLEAKGISNSQQSIEDFNYAIEITTARQYSGQLGRTVGRTRKTLKRTMELPDESMLGNKTENYCCFWLYQNHPALPDDWEHREEYPFDFLFNGNFIKNERNPKAEIDH
ncbi:uncharacterized protein LOC117791171 [Drosophila innubila]|uniref:uncharacterized protein LOC117791171 n=1 Tax=Drosophila innubila TaxID=198719 RepID=UPI00148C6343|nr:uncharacterized protein LOC117791171 [Drosophila innubila]